MKSFKALFSTQQVPALDHAFCGTCGAKMIPMESRQVMGYSRADGAPIENVSRWIQCEKFEKGSSLQGNHDIGQQAAI